MVIYNYNQLPFYSMLLFDSLLQKKMLSDERFMSTLEAEKEDHWLPIQILNAVCNVPNLSDDTQVEVLKVRVRIRSCVGDSPLVQTRPRMCCYVSELQIQREASYTR